MGSLSVLVTSHKLSTPSHKLVITLEVDPHIFDSFVHTGNIFFIFFLEIVYTFQENLPHKNEEITKVLEGVCVCDIFSSLGHIHTSFLALTKV